MMFRVIGTQYINGEPETVEISTRGTVKKGDGEFILEYDEFADGFGEFSEPSKTVMRVKENSVSIAHTNEMGADLLFEKEKFYSTVYSTPFGDFDLSVMPTYVSYDVSEEKGHVELEYMLMMHGMQTMNKFDLSYNK